MSLIYSSSNITLAHSLQNFYLATSKSFQALTSFLWQLNTISVRLRTGPWLIQNFNFCFSEGDLLLCFGLLFYCRIQVLFGLRSQTDGRTFSFRMSWWTTGFMVQFITASLPGPEGAKQLQTIIFAPLCEAGPIEGVTKEIELIFPKLWLRFGFFSPSQIKKKIKNLQTPSLKRSILWLNNINLSII